MVPSRERSREMSACRVGILRPTLDRDDPQRRPGGPGSLGARADRGGLDRRGPRRLRGARGIPPGLGEPLRAGPRLDVPARDLPLSPCRRRPGCRSTGHIPFDGFRGPACSGGSSRRSRRSARRMDATGPNGAIASALALAYEQITYQTLADQVRRSVRSCPGNRWMFRVGQADEHPIRLHPRLLERDARRRALPDPGRAHAGPARPVAQRLVRHLLPRHGLSRRGAGAEHLGRPGRPRPGRPAQPADRDVASASSPSRCCG